MTIREIIEGIGELAQRSNMTFDEAVEWISRNDRDENILPWEERKMEATMDMLIDAYAEMNHLTAAQVKEEIGSGWIDGNMLFEEWLKYEGIFGYSARIINVFDACEKAGLKITDNR